MTISQTNTQRLPGVAGAEPESGPSIIRIAGDRLLEAVMRLLAADGEGDQTRAERFIAFSKSNGVRLDSMWALVDPVDGRIRFSVLAVPNAGRTAMVFATRPRRKADVSEIGSIIDHVCIEIGREGVDLAQALLDPKELQERDGFLAGGFHELARLSYLERPLTKPRRGGQVQWPPDVKVETYREDLEPELLTVLDASYEDTLDCPGLRGLRGTRDILAGHKATGVFDPSLWILLRVDDQPAGVLLFNPSPAQRSIELVYIGLAKTARSRGLGSLLLRYGLRSLGGRPEKSITLAVDDRNEPALALYKREGFRRVLRRIALIRRTSFDDPCDVTCADPADAQQA